ncbi:MAG: hypothetical protein U0802_06410 [Candidatus Binatia bacterium]
MMADHLLQRRADATDPRLPEYVRLAKREGARRRVQSNATRLGESGLAAALAEAGLDGAMISLHGATAAVSDAVTGAPGTFRRHAARPRRAVIRTSIRVRLNFVFCQANRDDFPRVVDLVAQRGRRPGSCSRSSARTPT